jgi:hypothetical protein
LATYQYDGEQELVLPTLGVTVKKGEQFDAPDGLVIAGVSIASGKKAKAAEVVVDADLDLEISGK